MRKSLQTTATRRSVLMGAAGASLAAAGCETQAASSRLAEEKGAFAHAFTDNELLGPKKGVALLSKNENPYGPAPSAIKMMNYAARKGAYYPGEARKTLAGLIADRHGLAPENIAITTGSAEALSAAAMAFGRKGAIVAPRLFFDATALYAQRLGLAEIRRAPLGDDMSVDLAAIEAMVTDETGMVQLCNPNNPTGMLSEPGAFKAAVRRMAAKTTVVVDEAYMELVDDPARNSCVDLVREGRNVVVSRTFSKLYGMAGVRVGYTMSSPETARTIQSAAMSWMSGVGLAAAIGCYNDEKFIAYSKDKILEGREMISETLQALGCDAAPSQTNFVYFKSGRPANDVRNALSAKNIIVRGQYMDYSEWSRVSTGRLEDVVRFCKALPEILQA
ncbi:MAG: histidinol-phosphate transaminase [Pseudomonadota bacterium]